MPTLLSAKFLDFSSPSTTRLFAVSANDENALKAARAKAITKTGVLRVCIETMGCNLLRAPLQLRSTSLLACGAVETMYHTGQISDQLTNHRRPLLHIKTINAVTETARANPAFKLI